MIKIPYSALGRSTLLAHVKGAQVTAADADGVEIAACGFQPGIHRLATLVPFFAGADSVVITNGDVVQEGNRLVATRGAKHRYSGANPLFVPRSMNDPTLQAELMMKKLEKRARAFERRMEAYASKEADKEVKDDAEPKATAPKEDEAAKPADPADPVDDATQEPSKV